MFRLTGGHQETHIKKKNKTEVIIVMCSITPLLLTLVQLDAEASFFCVNKQRQRISKPLLQR